MRQIFPMVRPTVSVSISNLIRVSRLDAHRRCCLQRPQETRPIRSKGARNTPRWLHLPRFVVSRRLFIQEASFLTIMVWVLGLGFFMTLFYICIYMLR